MNSIKCIRTLIPIVLLAAAFMLCFTTLISCGTDAPVDPPKPEETPRPLVRKTQDLRIPENTDEVYAAEDARIEEYLGCHDGILYFLGSSPYMPDEPDSNQSNYLILSSPRTAQGGTLGVHADLGPAIECTALTMHNGKVILDMMTGDSPILSEGGGVISVDTDGRIQVLKEYGDTMPIVSMYGDHILYVTMPQPGDTKQTVESYDPVSGAWSSLFSLPLSCTFSDDYERVYTGTMLYRLGGVSNDGFWYALKSCPAPTESGDARSVIKYYDAKSGEGLYVIDCPGEVSSISGDEMTGYYAASNRDHIIYRSEQGVHTAAMPIRMRL